MCSVQSNPADDFLYFYFIKNFESGSLLCVRAGHYVQTALKEFQGDLEREHKIASDSL